MATEQARAHLLLSPVSPILSHSVSTAYRSADRKKGLLKMADHRSSDDTVEECQALTLGHAIRGDHYRKSRECSLSVNAILKSC